MEQQDKIVNALKSLPPEAQRQVVDFIDFLHARYQKDIDKHKSNKRSILEEPFVGMWKNKTDISDSSQWVKNLRKSEWGGDKL